MRMALRYGLSALMVVLGGYIIYHEYGQFQRVEGLLLGGLLIGWAFVRIWLTRRYLTPRLPTNSRRH